MAEEFRHRLTVLKTKKHLQNAEKYSIMVSAETIIFSAFEMFIEILIYRFIYIILLKARKGRKTCIAKTAVSFYLMTHASVINAICQSEKKREKWT